MVESYLVVLNAPDETVSGQIYNVGYENQSVNELAETVKQVVGDDVKLVSTPTNDNRSYHISSNKIEEELGFRASHSIREAVADLKDALKNGKLPNSLEDERYVNIKRMQNLNLK